MKIQFNEQLYYGLSSDEKPIGCDKGCAFIETDTENVYIWRQEEMAWIRVGSSLFPINSREKEFPYKNDSLTISTTVSALENGEIDSAYEMAWEDTVVRRVNKLIAEYSPQITCIACGAQLKSVTRGRRKFCAKCGVYLPRIIYNKSA